ncbi:MAG: hypothetical protein OJF47_002222 [Nitrospira sp.]|nr:MAG: hypothetical protein OJF47_002222 [Nitrospira sp.]
MNGSEAELTHRRGVVRIRALRRPRMEQGLLENIKNVFSGVTRR